MSVLAPLCITVCRCSTKQVKQGGRNTRGINALVASYCRATLTLDCLRGISATLRLGSARGLPKLATSSGGNDRVQQPIHAVHGVFKSPEVLLLLRRRQLTRLRLVLLPQLYHGPWRSSRQSA